MPYNNYLNTVSEKFEKLFSEIRVEYNFDNGPEFEIALCKALRVILPSKYGICRGFVVTLDGETAGDDIIIFDQDRFPTLRLLDDNNYAQKQQIPIEAVYAYIEAKHILCIEGDGGQSLEKALKQVSDIKKLERKRVPFNKVGRVTFGEGINVKYNDGWPPYNNPMYTAIISRGARLNSTSSVAKSQEFFPILKERLNPVNLTCEFPPDLIIAGEDVISLPVIGQQIKSPFYIKERSRFETFINQGLSFGVGMSLMFYAFDSIVLGSVQWQPLIARGLNVELV